MAPVFSVVAWRGWVRRLPGLVLVAVVLVSGVAEAAQGPELRPGVYRRLQAIQELLAEEAYAKAQSRLAELLPAVEGAPYEEAVVLRLWASVHLAQDDFPRAADRLARCLETGGLPEAEARRTRYDLAQLYAATEAYGKAVALLGPWLETAEDPPARAYLLLGQARAELGRKRPAAEAVAEAIRRADAPKESWYRFLLALYFELEDLPACSDLLETMIQRFPGQRDYWLQLAGVYQRRGQDEKALAVRELAYEQGLLAREREILDLAALYRYLGAPYKAARLLAHELEAGGVADTAEHWERLSRAWEQARETEKAADALAEAARRAGDGELWLRLARLRHDEAAWPETVAAAQAAIDAGVEDAGRARLLAGMAHYELEERAKARAAFEAASDDEQAGKAARQWLEYLDEEATPLRR